MTDTQATEAGEITGTLDKDYNLLWYTESCLENALRLEKYQEDAKRAEDTELAELFGKAQSDSRKGAEIGMRMLADRLTGMAPPASAATSSSETGNATEPSSGSEDETGEAEQAVTPDAENNEPDPRSEAEGADAAK